MPIFRGGSEDGGVTSQTRNVMVMPIHGTDHVTVYKRRWEDGDYIVYAVGHEDHFLGAVLIEEPCPTSQPPKVPTR